MISWPDVAKRQIQTHYDLATPFYRMLWGVHVHHGLWDADRAADDASPKLAQRRLTEHLAARARIEPGQIDQPIRVLDVGCGMGGSSLLLAREFGCDVTGVTLSPVQRAYAAATSRLKGVGRRTRFLRQDAETVAFDPQSFDVVWSIECTEHLFDKPAFFERAAQWLRPGGRIAICAWLASEEPHSPAAVEKLEAVCRQFLCPSLGTADDYCGWMRDAGLEVEPPIDLTERVIETWEICLRRVKRTGVSRIAWMFGRRMNEFVHGFETMLDAYRSGAMTYGSFAASRPS